MGINIYIQIMLPPGISTVTILKRRYIENGSLSAFRKLQRLYFKLRKAKLDLNFYRNANAVQLSQRS